jgi:hypothetical protein
MKLSIEEMNAKINSLIQSTNASTQAWSAELEMVSDQDVTQFTNPKILIPYLHDNDDWFTSEHYLLLVEYTSTDGRTYHNVESGFLAKWKDEDYFFWYDTDVIENVIGWMPLPKLNFTKRAASKAGSWF